MSFESSAFGLGNTSDEVRNPITAFNFVLEVEGVYFLPLKSVRAFTKENEYEYIKEGGVNDYVHMKRKPISKPFTFQVERYVGTERFLDPLANGTELALPVILHVYRHAAMRGFTALPDANPARMYTFTGCTVISKEYGELNSERSGILTEITTIAYRELLVVTNTFTSSEKEKWKSDGTKVKFAKEANNDKTGGIYKKDAQGFWTRIDNAEINKPAWTGEKGSEVLYAEPAKTDKSEFFPYTMRNVGDLHTLAKKDADSLYKPFWTGDKGTKVSYAEQQAVDKEDMYPYEKGKVGDIDKTWIMKDKESFKKDPWDGSKGTKNAYATTAGPDKANSSYLTEKDGTLKRVDKMPYNKAPWNGDFGSATSHATSQPNDKEGQSPYKKGDVGDIKNTLIMKEKSSFAKPQYELKKDGTKNKWARVSGKDSERAEQVIWPPTRRALMADALSKK